MKAEDLAYVLLRADETAKEVHSWGTIEWFACEALGNARAVTVGKVVIAPGEANPRHYHTTGEEVLTLLAGELQHSMGSERITLTAGDTLVVPANVPHNASNVGDKDAEMVVVYSSASRDFNLEERAAKPGP